MIEILGYLAYLRIGRSFDDIGRCLRVHRIHRGWTSSYGFVEHVDVLRFRMSSFRVLRAKPISSDR